MLIDDMCYLFEVVVMIVLFIIVMFCCFVVVGSVLFDDVWELMIVIFVLYVFRLSVV